MQGWRGPGRPAQEDSPRSAAAPRATRRQKGPAVETPATPQLDARPGYGALLRTRGAWTFLIPGFFARQPFAMLMLSIVLLVQHTTGSYGTAGAVSATAGVSMALLAPQGGRLADRFGQAAVLVPGAFLHAAAVTLLTALALLDAPSWALFASAVPAGATTPQISPMVRSRWAARLDGSPLMTTAAAFESVTDEFTFVVGPVLATALCTGVHPAAGLAAEAALMLCGGLLFAAQRRTQPPAAGPASGHRRPHASALTVPGVRVLIAVLLGIGVVFGGMQVSLAAFTESLGEPGMNGVLYGVFAGGNMLAALAVGAVQWKRGPRFRLLAAYPVLVVAALALAAVAQLSPWTPLLGGIGLIAGLCVAPAMIAGFTLVEMLVPAATRTEAFTWLTGAVALGQALGSTASGQLADAYGAGAGFLAPFLGTGLALLALLTFRAKLNVHRAGRNAARGVGHRSPVTVD